MISQFSSGWVPRGKSLYFFAPCRAMNKKQCSRPLTKRDESMTNQSYFRGATHIRSRQSLPGPSNPILLRWDKAADVSVPAPALSFSPPETVGRFQPGNGMLPAVLSVRWEGVLCRPPRGMPICGIIAQKTGKSIEKTTAGYIFVWD